MSIESISFWKRIVQTTVLDFFKNREITRRFFFRMRLCVKNICALISNEIVETENSNKLKSKRLIQAPINNINLHF